MKLAKTMLKKLAYIIRKEDYRWLFWSIYYPYNFGDWIGPFLFQEITKKEPWFALPSSYSASTVIMSAGSILGLARENSVIWGSGIMDRKVSFLRPWKIISVRGPYTRERCIKLGYTCPEIYGDPGLLLPAVYDSPSLHKPKKFELGIVPHFRDYKYIRDIDKFSKAREIAIIDPRCPIERIVDQITSCKRIVSSSLHGIVVAQAYNIQTGWVSFGNRLGGDGVKFYDHYASLDFYDPECLEYAHKCSIAALMDWADCGPSLDIEPKSKLLLSVCPFPFT